MRKLTTKICEHCATGFTTRWPAKFCSSRCRGRAYSDDATTRQPIDAIIADYRSGTIGIVKLCKKYHIGRELLLRLFKERQIETLSQSEIQSVLRRNGIGNHSQAKKISCKRCGVLFPVYPSYVKKGRGVYCSIKCRAGASEWILKLRHATAQNRLNTQRGKAPTKPERMIMFALDHFEVEYVFQYPLGGYIFDFFWPKENMLIECDGEYWHGDGIPEEKLKPWQRRNMERDKRKDRIAAALGYDVVRLTQGTIEKNFDKIMSV